MSNSKKLKVMRKKNFVLVAMLFAALSLGFVSCDNKGNEPDDPQGEQTEQGGSTENNGGGEETPTPEPADPYNGHAYVDLGLPSGLKWATCNVGATKPEEYGNYFAWGEVASKEKYDWSTYFDTTDGGTTFLKYNNEGGKTTLDPEDDAATVNMGGSWRMPTYDEQQELEKECIWTWTSDYNAKGVAGYIVTSKTNGKSIFLPSCGYYVNATLNLAGALGCYWSSSIGLNSREAYGFYFGSGSVTMYDDVRNCAQSVRGVIE